MIKSMTGFASLTREHEAATITATIKSVNHRFLDVQMRIPATIAPLETRLRGLVQQHVARGRVEVVVGVQQRRAATLDVDLNEEFLTALGGAIERARQQGYVAGEMTPGDLLRFPQALAIRERITEADADLALLTPLVENTVDAAVADLDAMRATEGTYLRADLEARRVGLGALFTGVAQAAELGM